MPIFKGKDMNDHKLAGSSYGFSAKRIDDLGASEYTLVAIAADVSGSVSSFKKEIESCVREIVRACRHSPRADNLMLRFTRFDSRVSEVHAFMARHGMWLLLDAFHDCSEWRVFLRSDLSRGDP